MSDQLMHYGVKGMRRGTRKSREERNAERRAKYEAKLKAKYGIDDVGKIENYLKKRKEHAEKVKNWRLANQRNRQLTATERREKYYGELDRGKLGKTYSTDATLAEAARKFYKKGHNKRMGHSELIHFGVKGMRWGVRKQRIKDAKKWTSKKQAKIDGMSDDQLRKANNRLRLEKEYKQLTQTRMERYRNKVGKAAEEAAFNTLQNVIQKGLKKAAGQGAKRFKHSETRMSDNIFFIDEDEVLAHHGVKGMRWGVRKQRPSGGAGPSKKRKGLSRKQKAAIAGVLGTAAAVGGGYYLHKSGNGKKIAALAKKQGAAAKAAAGATKSATSRAGSAAKGAASSAKSSARRAKAYAKLAAGYGKRAGGTLGEMGRVTAGTAGFKAKMTAKKLKYGTQRKAWKAGNQARNAAKKAASTARGGAGGIKSAVKTATTRTVKQRPAPVNSLAKTTKNRVNMMQVLGQVARENAKGAAVGLGASGALNVAARSGTKKGRSRKGRSKHR